MKYLLALGFLGMAYANCDFDITGGDNEELYSKMNDNNSSTYWESERFSGFIQFDFGTDGKNLTRITLERKNFYSVKIYRFVDGDTKLLVGTYTDPDEIIFDPPVYARYLNMEIIHGDADASVYSSLYEVSFGCDTAENTADPCDATSYDKTACCATKTLASEYIDAQCCTC